MKGVVEDFVGCSRDCLTVKKSKGRRDSSLFWTISHQCPSPTPISSHHWHCGLIPTSRSHCHSLLLLDVLCSDGAHSHVGLSANDVIESSHYLLYFICILYVLYFY